jgi:hypothetical protein
MRALAGVALISVGMILSTLPVLDEPAPAAVREMPCPDAKPAFDHTRINRELKEPAYGSERPLYRYFAFGPDGETVMAMVADESKGTGSGVDTLYIDLNANHDITEPGEKFALAKPRPPGKAVKADRPDLVVISLTDWAKDILPRRRLDVPDPTFVYQMSVGSGFVHITTTTRDNSWRVPLRLMDTIPWSTSRQRAPVFRIGGSDFHLKNEQFVEVHEGRRTLYESGVGRKIRPGTMFSVDGTAPFFAGSSPSAYLGWFYVEGGHPGLRAWIESVEDPSQPVVAEIILRGY